MCKCVNIPIGSYARQTSMKHNFNTSNDKDPKGWVCIDTCLVQEIAELWYKGIRTVECCCGHNIKDGYIAVIDIDDRKMIELGYERVKPERPHHRIGFFYPKSVERIIENNYERKSNII